LKLQPRSKPAEENKENAASSRASIFGAAKPVDTYAREKEIENTIHKPKSEAAPHAPRANIFGSAKPVDTSAREKEIEAKLKSDDPPPRKGHEDEVVEAPLSRQNSSASTHSGHEEPLHSPTLKEEPQIVPAPPPKENPWGKKSFTDVSNNATPVSHPPSSAAKRVTPEKDAVSHDTKRDAPSNRDASGPKTSAWGRGPPSRSEGHSREGNYGRGHVEAHKPKPKPERHIPQHYDEMPKLEENKGADFTMKNKFAFLPEDDDDEGNHSGEEANES